MKIISLLPLALTSVMVVSAKSPPTTSAPPFPPIPGFATNQLGVNPHLITNRDGQFYSTEAIQFQLGELRRTVELSVPMVEALAGVESNRFATLASNGSNDIAGALSGALQRYTNTVTGAPSENTNGLARLMAILNAATSNSPPATAIRHRELVSLHEHLEATSALLDRLGVMTNFSLPSDIGGSDEGTSDRESGSARNPKK